MVCVLGFTSLTPTIIISISRGRIITVHIAVGIIVRTITTAIIAVVTIIRTIPVRGVFGMISRTTPAAVQISVRLTSALIRISVRQAGMMYIPRDVATVVIIALAQVHVTAVRDVVVWIVAESRVKRK